MLSLTAFSEPALAAWLWSPESGKWTNTKDVPRDAPNEQFQAGLVPYEEGDYDRALDEFNKLIKHYPNSRWAAEGQYHRGLVLEKQGDVGKAAEAFRTLIDRYPYSDRLNDAVEHEFELAEAMLEGKKTRFLGMEIIPAQDTAADLYRHIVRSAPYGPYGDIAQFRIGDAELAQGNFEEAEQAYQGVIDEYPNSEYAPKAKFKIAQVSYKSAFKEEHHLVKTDDALDRFEGFKRAYPDSFLQFEADDAIQALREKKAVDIYEIASFYQHRKKYNSAKLYFNDIVRSFPETETAKQARERLMDITILEEGGSLPSKRILGLFPIGESVGKDDVSEAKEDDVVETRKRKSFLGIIPLGYEEEEPEAKPDEVQQARKRKSFLGIIPLGYEEEEPVEEVQEEETPEESDEFLGLFV